MHVPSNLADLLTNISIAFQMIDWWITFHDTFVHVNVQ